MLPDRDTIRSQDLRGEEGCELSWDSGGGPWRQSSDGGEGKVCKVFFTCGFTPDLEVPEPLPTHSTFPLTFSPHSARKEKARLHGYKTVSVSPCKGLANSGSAGVKHLEAVYSEASLGKLSLQDRP